MNEEEREIVKKFERLYLKDFNNEKITNEDRLSYIECVLMSNLIEKLQKENEELTEASKELCKTVNLMKKVINEMAEYIIDLIKYNNSEEERDKEEIKEYFTKKAEKGE